MKRYRGSSDEEELPFQSVSEDELFEQGSSARNRRVVVEQPRQPQRQQQRYNLRARPFHTSSDWLTMYEPLVEDPVFNRQYIATYTGTRGLNIPSQFNAHAWRPHSEILDSFYRNVIGPILQANGGSANIQQMRLYVLAGQNRELLIVRERPGVAAWLQPAGSGFGNHLKRVLRNTVSAFLLRGASGDSQDAVVQYGNDIRNMNQLEIRVDIQTRGGGARNSDFAQQLLNAGIKKAWLFNPARNEMCFVTCMKKAGYDLSDEPGRYGRTIPVDEVVSHAVTELPQVYLCILDPLCKCLCVQVGEDFDESNPKMVFIVLVQEHYYLVLDHQKLFKHFYNATGWCGLCHRCMTPSHDCEAQVQCDRCSQYFDTEDIFEEHKSNNEDIAMKCGACGKGCYSQNCLEEHEAKGCTAAERKVVRRVQQRQAVDRWREDKIHCQGCTKYIRKTERLTHPCTLTSKSDYEEPYEPVMYTFDMETMSCEHPQNPAYRVMSVNLICVRRMYADNDEANFHTLEEFVDFLDQVADQYNTDGHKRTRDPDSDEHEDEEVKQFDVVFYAHNLSKFDGRILVEGLYALQAVREIPLIENQTVVGRKLLQFTYRGIVFKDSLLHLTMALAAMPKVFEFEDEVVKGHFPHRLNSQEYQQFRVRGALPDIQHWELSMKKQKHAKEIIDWHCQESQRLAETNGEWIMETELLKYCQDDCRVLAKALEIYNDAGRSMFGTNYSPLRMLTIAGYTKDVFWRKYLDVELLEYHNRAQHELARDALRGGRTDVRRFYDCVTKDQYFQQGKRIVYQDVCSLYPYVMVDRKYPTGKPVLHATPSIDDLQLAEFGFAEIDIDPPPFYHHHPPLPCRDDLRNGRLTATLEPKKKVTFCLQEIHKAQNQGWTVTKVYRLMTYPAGTDELFKPFMSILLAEKVHSSFDYEDKAPEDWENLVQLWNEKFGVEIDVRKLGRNPGRRQLFKIMLNSLWGKLCERMHNTINVNCTTEQLRSYYSFERNGFLNIRHCDHLGPNRWYLCADIVGLEDVVTPNSVINHINNMPGVDMEQSDGYKASYIQKEAKWFKYLRNSAVHIGSYVTMWGRSVLEEQMEKLDQRVLYHDTDSIIYKVDSSADYQIPRGSLLGEWEVECDTIIEFVSLAPKVYAYKYLGKPQQTRPVGGEFWKHGDLFYPILEICKAKGFTLHQKAAERINFAGLKQLYFNTQHNGQQFFQPPIAVPQFTMKFDETCKSMIAYDQTKRLNFKYEKGVIGMNHTAFPFGVDQYWDPQLMYADSTFPMKTMLMVQ
jgi:hypothetical protein